MKPKKMNTKKVPSMMVKTLQSARKLFFTLLMLTTALPAQELKTATADQPTKTAKVLPPPPFDVSDQIISVLGLPSTIEHASASNAPEILSSDHIGGYATELQQLQSMALKANIDVKKAELQVNTAEAAKSSATAAFHPQLYLQGQVDRSKVSEAIGYVRQTELQYGIGVKQNLFNGLADQRHKAQADKHLMAMQMQQQKEQLLLKARVQLAIYKYHAAHGLLTIATLAQTQAAAVHDLSQRKEKAGLNSQIDRLQAETQLANASLQKSNAAQEVDAALLSLRSLFAGSWNADAEELLHTIIGKISTSQTLKLYDNLAAAPLTMSLDEKIAQVNAQQSDDALSAAYGSRYLPSLDAYAQIQKQRNMGFGTDITPSSPTAAPDRITTDVGLSASWNLWNERDSAEIKQKIAAKQMAAAELQDIQLKSLWNQDRITAKLRQLYASLAVTQSSYQAFQQIYRGQLRLYQAGTGDIFKLIDAQVQWLDAVSRWLRLYDEMRSECLKYDLTHAGVLAAESQL